jgi:Ser/Thr protein kinase RdoA (MazF antagonist)
MEKRIKERFNDAILREATARYDIAPDRIHLLDGFESFMYAFDRGPESCILRIGHTFRRSEALIQGEVDWINYLAGGGATVAPAVLSAAGNLVEPLDDGQGEQFLATAFLRARGRPPREADWTPPLYETYGWLLGRMHALSKGYEPADPAWRRPQWDSEIMLDVETHLPETDTGVAERFRELMAHLTSLPRDAESYGLIHFDAHGGNFFVDDGGTITLFDFDDCNYSWFANDLAIVLFYLLVGRADGPAFLAAFMPHFLRGYRGENRLDAAWLREIPHFMKLREIDLYAIIHRSFDVENLDDHPWCARFMRDRRERIEAGVPFVDYDFEALFGLL